MRYGTDYEPVFREIPDDWRGRWRLLREFIDRWHGIPTGDIGGRQREIRRVEKRLGHSVSPAIPEWVAFHADIEDSWEQVFRDRYDVRSLDNGAAVSLLLQWERDLYYAVRTENLDSGDPPVEEYALGSHAMGRRFENRRRSADHLSSFVFYHIDFKLIQGVSSDWCQYADLESQQDVLELANAAFPVASYPIGSCFNAILFFETTNLLGWLDRRLLLLKAPRWLSRQELPICLREYLPEGKSFREMVVRWKHD
jgi:hypothetical protein